MLKEWMYRDIISWDIVELLMKHLDYQHGLAVEVQIKKDLEVMDDYHFYK